MKQFAISLFAMLLSTLCWAGSGYDYPIDNALAATIVGTPKEYAAELPNSIRRSE